MKTFLLALLLSLTSVTAFSSVPQQYRHLVHNGYIPERAFAFRETIYDELNKFFPQLHDFNYIPALIEQESCITIRHRRCWTSTAQLRSQREEGAGLGQITRAFRPDGSIRFDSLTEMVNRYRDELRGVNWSNIYIKPDAQIRIIILMIRDKNRRLFDVDTVEARLHMVNAAYNGGLGGLQRERRACAIAANCDPDIWFGHVERHCLKSRRALYGTRSACDINRTHVYSTFNIRLPKYQARFFTAEWLASRN